MPVKANYKVKWINSKNKLFGGIQLSPNSIRCLKILGCYEKLKKVANPISNIRIRSPNELSDLNSFDVNEYFTISREKLYSILKSNILKYNSLDILYSPVSLIEIKESLCFCSTILGKTIKANLIIGADGINGITRNTRYSKILGCLMEKREGLKF